MTTSPKKNNKAPVTKAEASAALKVINASLRGEALTQKEVAAAQSTVARYTRERERDVRAETKRLKEKRK